MDHTKIAHFCSFCGAKILPNTFFCFKCGPPELPKREPEEVGISIEQAIKRIIVMVFLFLCVVLVKLNFFSDNFISSPARSNEDLSSNKKEVKQDDLFELIHTVIPSSANVRSKPSMDGEIIAIVEEGMNLTVIERKKEWSKVDVYKKTGWIASKLIKSEVQPIN